MIGEKVLSLKEICAIIGPDTNEDALLRTLKLLVSAGVLDHSYIKSDLTNGNNKNNDEVDVDEKDFFSLADVGVLLQTNVCDQLSMAYGIRHWMEELL